MKRSWLIQRLDPPHGGDNPFAFGGGLRNGGLSDEAMGLLRGIFSFDYMGAAEFEFGAVPKALNSIANDATRFRATTFTIKLTDVAKNFRDVSEPDGEATIYVICRMEDLIEATERIRGWAKEPYGGLKEITMLSNVLRPAEGGYEPRTKGWLELDNGFFFFVDEEMWSKTAKLFGISTL